MDEQLSETHVGSRKGSLTKIKRYDWIVIDAPGILREMDKHVLTIDESYQRGAKEPKVLDMAGKWSWVACGVIIVADRNGVFYVIDGQHRVLAARRRADIGKLPCLVFETTSAVVEAKGFLMANTLRKPMAMTERFKALLVTGDEGALIIQRMCEEVGREVSNAGTPRSVRCVAAMLRIVSRDAETLARIWPMIDSLMHGQPINQRIVEGLWFIESHMRNGESLTDTRWRQRVMRVGSGALLEGAVKASSFHAKGGAKIWAEGMLNAINRGCRIHLKLKHKVDKGDQPDEDSDEPSSDFQL